MCWAFLYARGAKKGLVNRREGEAHSCSFGATIVTVGRRWLHIYNAADVLGSFRAAAMMIVRIFDPIQCVSPAIPTMYEDACQPVPRDDAPAAPRAPTCSENSDRWFD
jgi:hypothetical protein